MSEKISCTIDIQDVINAGREFINLAQKDKNARYRSWEHCYKQFTEHQGKKFEQKLTKEDYDTLALHLAFYLASWGMYRGSSFLLQQDYKVHTEAVKLLMDEEYNSLWYSKNSEDYDMKLLETLVEELENIYKKIRTKIRENTAPLETSKDNKSETISPILITKILMGTIGCTPAYDRFFIDSMKKYKIASHIFKSSKNGLQSMQQLAEYYKDNIASFKELQKEIFEQRKMIYPPMKILDMCFWQLSFSSPETN